MKILYITIFTIQLICFALALTKTKAECTCDKTEPYKCECRKCNCANED